jgi:hypothetical protein
MRVGARRVDRIYEGVDHADRIVLIDPVVQGFRKKRPLSAIRALYEALHPIPCKPLGNHTTRLVFIQPGSDAAVAMMSALGQVSLTDEVAPLA